MLFALIQQQLYEAGILTFVLCKETEPQRNEFGQSCSWSEAKVVLISTPV